MNVTLFFCLWLGLLVYVVTFTALTVTLNLRLRNHYPQIYEAVGKPRLFSRYPDFLWELPAHRAVLGDRDWRLRMLLVRLYWLGMAAALAAAVSAAWSIFGAHRSSAR